MLFLEKGVKRSPRRIDLGRSGGCFLFQVAAQREKPTFIFVGLALDARGDRLGAFKPSARIEEIAESAVGQMLSLWNELPVETA